MNRNCNNKNRKAHIETSELHKGKHEVERFLPRRIEKRSRTTIKTEIKYQRLTAYARVQHTNIRADALADMS